RPRDAPRHPPGVLGRRAHATHGNDVHRRASTRIDPGRRTGRPKHREEARKHPEAKAELIRTLDEKFVANSIAFDAMIAASALLVEGGPLRASDGAIDLVGIRARFEAVTWHVPAMRQRLAPTPLRLTTPAWVPVERLDIARHVTLHPIVERDDPEHVEV